MVEVIKCGFWRWSVWVVTVVNVGLDNVLSLTDCVCLDSDEG